MASGSRSFAPLDFKKRLPALDGLRALAITLVFLDHYRGGKHEGGILQLAWEVTSRGWVGVDLFFVLSGFLITGILYDTRNDSRYFYRFYGRRALRILPVSYMALLLLVFLTPILHYQWHWAQLSYVLYLGNVFGVLHPYLTIVPSSVYPHAQAVLSHFWSLCVEEQFYLLWPLVVWSVRDRLRLIWIAGSVSLLALAFRIAMVRNLPVAACFRWISYTLPFRMDALLIGAILALVLRGPFADNWQRSAKWFFLVFVGPTLLVLSLGSARNPWVLTLGLTLNALTGAGLIGTALRPASAISKIFQWKPLRVLGKYSYGFYVYHLLFLAFWTHLRKVLTVDLHSVALSGLIELPLNFGITFIVSKLSYDYIESRFLKLKTHFLYDSEMAERQSAVIAKPETVNALS